MDTTVEKETADTGYNDLFGELSSTPTLPFEKPDIERIQSLGHEPLFPGQFISPRFCSDQNRC